MFSVYLISYSLETVLTLDGRGLLEEVAAPILYSTQHGIDA